MELADFFLNIILLSQTCINPDYTVNFEIPGYSMITLCWSPTNKRAKRRSGGLVCYIDEIAEDIRQIDDIIRNEDRLWLKLDSRFFGFPSDLFLCFTYISPATSTSTSARENIWQLLTTEIV